MLYEKKIDEILDEGYSRSETGQVLSATTVFMPEILRLGLAELREKYNVSAKYLIERVTTHGHSIIQHKYLEQIKTIRKQKSILRYAKMDAIRNFNDSKVSIDSMIRSRTKYIHLKEGVISSIRELSDVLNIDQSSFIRVCILYSLSTSVELNREVIEKGNNTKEIFGKRISSYVILYKHLKLAEEEYNKKWKTEENVGI